MMMFIFIFYFRQGCGGGTTPGTASSFGSFGGNDADQEDNVDEEIDEKSPKLKGLDEADECGKGPFLSYVSTLEYFGVIQ